MQKQRVVSSQCSEIFAVHQPAVNAAYETFVLFYIFSFLQKCRNTYGLAGNAGHGAADRIGGRGPG